MTILPPELTPLLVEFAPAFSRPTYRRFLVLLVAAILTTGRRTGANLLRTIGALAPGHAPSYRRVLSRARWSTLQLACTLTRHLVDRLIPDGPITLVGDATVDGHPGPKVYGKARHRDPVRSSHGYTAWRYGHKWVVLAVLVRFPWATRPWALPVLVALYRSEEDDRREGRPHRTPAQLMQRLLCAMLRWSPDRPFVLVGDSGLGTHAMARFIARHKRLELVSKLPPDAGLYEPPPPYRGLGRPRVKGARVPTPRRAAAAARLRRMTVGWYGGGTRRVEVATGIGCWSKSGKGLVPLRWVFVRDRTGTHRDEFFSTTDLRLSVRRIIGLYTGRWNIETTFQEVRSCLGLETTRGWCRATVLRAAPCLFGLYSVVAVLYHELPEGRRTGGIDWPGKVGVTFSDALVVVRRWLWSDWVFARADEGRTIQKLPAPIREVVYSALATAA
jgi:hypothetical protein